MVIARFLASWVGGDSLLMVDRALVTVVSVASMAKCLLQSGYIRATARYD
jgi:hypothetical protein